MTLYNVLKLFHVIAAVVFAGGLFARQAVRAYATSTDDVVWFAHVMKAAAHIERRMVRPGSRAVLALGIVQARLGGIPIFGTLTGGNQNWLLVCTSGRLRWCRSCFFREDDHFGPRWRRRWNKDA